MANRERGEVTATVDGRDYTLRLSINAQCELEDRLSTPDHRQTYGDIVIRLRDGKDTTALRAMLWACLREFHRADFPTLDAVGELMGRAGRTAVFRFVADAIAAAQPAPEDVEAMKGDEAPPTADEATARPQSPPVGRTTGRRSIGPVVARA